MMITDPILEKKAIDTIRTLAIDAIEKAGSGHPGLPMGAAPMAYELWAHEMKHNPRNPLWVNRDRFVLSAGHGSMLLYSLLHLFGYNLPLAELQNFRQWESRTPGHPEYGHTPGVEATTGPLGQGFGMAVGMALAEAHLAAVYNRDGFPLMDHYTFVLCGDGDLMEGVTAESASLAGHLQLRKLIVLYDSNDVSLDGDLHLSFSERIQQRFDSCNWHVQFVADGNCTADIQSAIQAAKADHRPSLIEIKTKIGYGSPHKSGRSGKQGAHGVPLGKDETVLTKQYYGWPTEPAFFIPDDVKDHFHDLSEQGAAAETKWNSLFHAYQTAHPELADQFEAAMNGQFMQGWQQELPLYTPDDKPLSTRAASELAIQAIAAKVPQFIGGSADLASSTLTGITSSGRLSRSDYSQRNLFYGVREFAMGAALNGIMLHKGLIAFAGAFLVFSDYLRPAIRLASLMRLPVVYVFTHDSIAVGEDGPTHQPIEHLAALRCIPGLTVLRPADANETTFAWEYALSDPSGPCALILSRQPLPILVGTKEQGCSGLSKGAYVLSDPTISGIQALLIATGSEVQLALAAQRILAEQNIFVRVISMPSWELFERQSEQYKDSVLLPGIDARISIEMGSSQGWHLYTGKKGCTMSINRYGASAPAETVMRKYGFTAEAVVHLVITLLA